jgi:hypothetical protein
MTTKLSILQLKEILIIVFYGFFSCSNIGSSNSAIPRIKVTCNSNILKLSWRRLYNVHTVLYIHTVQFIDTVYIMFKIAKKYEGCF